MFMTYDKVSQTQNKLNKYGSKAFIWNFRMRKKTPHMHICPEVQKS